MDAKIAQRVDEICRLTGACTWTHGIRNGPYCELHKLLDADNQTLLRLYGHYMAASYYKSKGHWPWVNA
jgi:hypothetical protein